MTTAIPTAHTNLASEAPIAGNPSGPERRALLDPGMDLTLRPMRYPHFYDRFRDAIKNTGPSRRSTCTQTSKTSLAYPRPSSI